jgi:DNA-binding PadR family transcriptional regulator
MSSDLRPFSYAVLAIIGDGGASTPELVEMVTRGAPFFWTRAPTQAYDEPPRLERLGYLKSRTEPARTRPRRVYKLTAKGRRALREWLRRPAPFPRIEHEANLRLVAGDLLDDGEIVDSLTAMRAELDHHQRLIAKSLDRLDARLPHRARYLRLDYSLAQRLIDAHRAWIDDVESELSHDRDSTGTDRVTEVAPGHS